MRAVWVALALVLPHRVQALDLILPNGAEATETRDDTGERHRLAVGAAEGQITWTELDGHRRDQAFRIAPAMTTDGLASNLLRQLTGYSVTLDCRDVDCGGYDFRFDLDLLPEPDMHVDLGDFRYVTALEPGGKGGIALMISRSGSASFLQVTEISAAKPTASAPTPQDTAAPDLPKSPQELVTSDEPPVAALGSLDVALRQEGHVVIEGLAFATGSADLGPGEFPALVALADWLAANPTARIAVVGHTDAVGSLAANVALSQRRAASVVSRLVDLYGIDPARLSAEGAGYLSPRADNLTDAGREKNRRVEAVLVQE